MPQRVVVVTDTTADIPADRLKQYNILMVPQNIIWGTQTYRDGLDITNEQFYQRLRTEKDFPKTSQPAPGTFQEYWLRAAPTPDTAILSIHVSNHLSGTVSSALTARQLMPNYTIEVFDSQAATMALGYMALSAAQVAAQGGDMAACIAAAQAVKDKMHLLFLVDTLEFLRRGGRIGNAAWLVGTMLNLKPILQLEAGRVTPLERVRTRAKGLERLFAIADARLNGKPARFGVVHVAAPDEAAQLAESVRTKFDCRDLVVSPTAPAIGAHVGPGTLGLIFCEE